jgi:hypothetical protein
MTAAIGKMYVYHATGSRESNAEMRRTPDEFYGSRIRRHRSSIGMECRTRQTTHKR